MPSRWLAAAAAAAVALVPAGAGAAPSPPGSVLAEPLVSAGPASVWSGLSIKAPTAIVVDERTGEVLYVKRPYLRRPIASTTKIMTAVVAMSRLHPTDLVRVPREATRVQPYREGLKAGERVPVWKLYYGLLLESGNDTAVTLAVAAGGTREHFLALMNEKARALGLGHTHFRSASGLIDEGNYSTVWDLAALARCAMWSPRFRRIVGTKKKRVSWRPPTNAKLYENHNKLLWRYRGADGIKTGWTTAAGPCLVASARRNGVSLISVVLDSPELYADTKRLLDYGFRARG